MKTKFFRTLIFMGCFLLAANVNAARLVAGSCHQQSITPRITWAGIYCLDNACNTQTQLFFYVYCPMYVNL